ncbi:MAG: 5'/3'-nucleotidase SurE [Porticoccaceae bacterium]
MSRYRRQLPLTLALLALTAPLHALDILLTNDDGLSANVRALYQALRSDGHKVMVSVPCRNQSGQGAALNFLRPVGPLTVDCVGGIARAGAPGVGSDAGDPDLHYVDGTPVMALLYGLDLLAEPRWGRQPQLIISGPNEGNNTGLVNPSSGTVNNAVYGINRGIPSVAVSADRDTADNPVLAAETAQIVLKLVHELERRTPRDGALLPDGTGLNVNVPRFAAGASNRLPFARAVVGTYSTGAPKFVASLAADPMAAGRGITAALPGISFEPMDAATAESSSEALLIEQGKIAVSVIEGNFGAGPVDKSQALLRVNGLFRP